MRIARGGLAAAVAGPQPAEIDAASSAGARCASSAVPTGRSSTASTTRREIRSAGARPGRLRRRWCSRTAAPRRMTDAGLKMRVQFYTSRGFAVLDVNYSGSTGYGRAYRQRLDGAWGIADVADCAAGARHLAQGGPRRWLAHRHRRRQRRRLHHADGARHHGRVRRRQQPLRHLRPRPPARAHAQVRVGLPASPDGHDAGQLEGGVRGALAHQPDRRHQGAA